MKSCAALLVVLFSVAASAQQPEPPKPPSAPAGPKAPSLPVPVVTEPVGLVPVHEGKPINVRLDISVIDQTAAGTPQPKTLMVILHDGAQGRTRAAFEDRSISVDARPTLVDGRIRVNLTLESNRSMRRGDDPPSLAVLDWRNGFSLLLDNGKPMIALETSDAVTKRKMSIEVKATILK